MEKTSNSTWRRWKIESVLNEDDLVEEQDKTQPERELYLLEQDTIVPYCYRKADH